MEDEGATRNPRSSGYPRSFEKWGIDVVRSGYTLIPNHLISLNTYLSPNNKLKPVEMIVLFIIISNWWNAETFPAASKRFIAERCGISVRQVQRTISSLEEKGLVKRIVSFDSGGANRFDLTSLLRLIATITRRASKRNKSAPVQLELKYDGGVGNSTSYDEEIPF